MIKVATISYLNALPFIYGLSNSCINKEIELCMCTPAQGAQMLGSGVADIGIVPVVAGMQLPDTNIVTDYCIGAVTDVASVLLCSGKPLSEIKKIYLDTESKTSVILCKVLCKHYWKINVEFEDFNFSSNNFNPDSSYIIIGDKALISANKFEYVYDLATEWINYKQKPFVFACWFANNKLDNSFILKFNDALKYGINNIPKLVESGSFNFSKEYVYKYLSENISYTLDSYKKEGLQDFWQLAMAELRSKVRW